MGYNLLVLSGFSEMDFFLTDLYVKNENWGVDEIIFIFGGGLSL